MAERVVSHPLEVGLNQIAIACPEWTTGALQGPFSGTSAGNPFGPARTIMLKELWLILS